MWTGVFPKALRNFSMNAVVTLPQFLNNYSECNNDVRKCAAEFLAYCNQRFIDLRVISLDQIGVVCRTKPSLPYFVCKDYQLTISVIDVATIHAADDSPNGSHIPCRLEEFAHNAERGV